MEYKMMNMNWERFGKKWLRPNRCTLWAFAWRGWGKPRNLSVKITGVLSEIRTEHAPTCLNGNNI
jgi:hypothetical protein